MLAGGVGGSWRRGGRRRRRARVGDETHAGGQKEQPVRTSRSHLGSGTGLYFIVKGSVSDATLSSHHLPPSPLTQVAIATDVDVAMPSNKCVEFVLAPVSNPLSWTRDPSDA